MKNFIILIGIFAICVVFASAEDLSKYQTEVHMYPDENVQSQIPKLPNIDVQSQIPMWSETNLQLEELLKFP